MSKRRANLYRGYKSKDDKTASNPSEAERQPRATVTLRQALADPRLLGNALVGDSWNVWKPLMLATMGEPLTESELEIFRQVTQRETAPTQRIEEAWFIIGRRGGKDRAASVISAYTAALIDWSPVLSPGETALVLCVGADQTQASVQLSYVEGVFDGSPILSRMVKNRTASAIELRNNITIEVRSANFRRLRGPTAVAIIASEAAFWMDSESSTNPDTEILGAARPMLATTGGPLVVITTPHARKGETWQTFKQHYGANGDPAILVAQGPSTKFNPTLAQSVIDRAYQRDPSFASAEYGAEFRSDLEIYVSREMLAAVTPDGLYERPPERGYKYVAFCDPAGGSGRDSFTLAISHRDADQVFLDAIREYHPPFSPSAVIAEFSGTLKSYGVRRVTGDRFAGQFPAEMFRQHGITYEVAKLPKSSIYIDALALIASRKVELLDNVRLVNQFAGLERSSARGARDRVDHQPRVGHDDLANAAAGALLLAYTGARRGVRTFTLYVFDAYGRLVAKGRELDPATGQPLDSQEGARVRWTKIAESDAPAAQGFC